MAKAGRPEKPIIWEEVDIFLKAGCSQIKIAESFQIDADTLRRRVQDKYGMDYATYAASMASRGKMLIVAKQYQKAMEGNIKMLIWLGRVLCEQKPETIDSKPPLQDTLEKDNLIMELKHQNTLLLEKLEQDADEP